MSTEWGPIGTWAQRWLPFVCNHNLVRCTHGDEIIHRSFRRRVCVICGRALRGTLPEPCSVTGRPHFDRAAVTDTTGDPA